MSSIMDMVQEHLGDNGMAQLSQHLGVDANTAQAAAAAALPMIVGAMGHGGSQPGATPMPPITPGSSPSGLLGNLFGGNHAQMSQQVSRSSGLDIHQAEKALLFLAPIVMAQLARKRQGATAAAPSAAAAAAPSPAAANAPPPSGPATSQGQPPSQEQVQPGRSGLGGVLDAVERIFHKGS